MDGVIIVNKPQDWTSFDVVAKIRNLSKVKKVGHSGTLDPMATGVLPVFLGRATKSIQYFLEGDKGYLAEMTLGVKTDTGDITGKALTLNPSPIGRGTSEPSEDRVREVIKKYTGEIEQVPPMYSAKKVNGQRLYDLARRGIEVERKPQKVHIYELRMTPTPNVSHDATATSNRITLAIRCSKGTYIRQMVTDIGDDLGCGATLSKLERTYAHPFRFSQAINMDTIITLAKIGRLDTIVIPISALTLDPSPTGRGTSEPGEDRVRGT